MRRRAKPAKVKPRKDQQRATAEILRVVSQSPTEAGPTRAIRTRAVVRIPDVLEDRAHTPTGERQARGLPERAGRSRVAGRQANRSAKETPVFGAAA